MSYDDVFLSAMLAAPDDATPRLVYADWLEERGDYRAELLRHDWDVPRISFIDWNWVRENLEFYLDRYPELRGRLREHEANRRWRDRLAALSNAVNPDWLAAIDTLGRPFHPFFFWNNTGPRSFGPGELPFREQLGTRGTVVTFESAFRSPGAWEPGLVHDLRFLQHLRLDECAYGAATCPTHSFMCELATGRRPLTGADVIEALKAREFRSQHIPTLRSTAIPYPGYHPGIDNDEIHNDPVEQNIFPRPDEAMEPEDLAARLAAHEALRDYVDGGQLWYVLLHDRAGLAQGGVDRSYAWWVVLFAVGRSPHGNRLLGVVSHQACHNLCD